MSIDDRLGELDLELPKPMQTANLPFDLTRIEGTTMYLSGHVPTELDGSIAKPLGKVGEEVSPEQAYEAARKVALGLFASIHAAIGGLDRVDAWLRVFGMVNVAPGFNAIPPVINGCSDLILEVFGPERGAHTRSAVGMAELPFGVPVEIEAQIKIKL
jgi:enamine deaminase RidA (YjgF/YER057c/UK114 family)